MKRLLAVAAAFCALALPVAAQQGHMQMPGMHMPANPPTAAMPGMNMEDEYSKLVFRPGLGELMLAFVQPRHIKLGLAGAAQNWDYAAYELNELQETFDGIGQLILKQGDLAITPDM